MGLVVPVLALLTQRDFTSEYPVLRPLVRAVGDPSGSALVVWGMAALVTVFLAKGLFLVFLSWRQTNFAYTLQSHLSQRLFASYLREPYAFHLQRNSAELTRNVLTEVSVFVTYGLQPGMTCVNESLIILGLCVLLFVVEPVGAPLAMVVVGGAGWAAHYLTRERIVRWGELRQHHDGLRLRHLQQGLAGARDVKLLGRENELLRQYWAHNERAAAAGRSQVFLQQLPRIWLDLIAVAGLAILVTSMRLNGRSFEEFLPTLGLFAAATFRLMPSVNRLVGSVQSIRYSLPAIRTLREELRHFPTAREEDGMGRIQRVRTVPSFETGIHLANITYNYPGASSPALTSISVSIKKGESVGFVGPSGAGKSTLVDILLGLLTPETGEVRVDGKDIQEDMRGWQDQLGYVPQSIFLTDDTLRRNIAFGLADDAIDDEAVRRAVCSAQLDEFVTDQPLGLETLVGERGVSLSGGQRQRVGIARAIYHNPAVLVLDEASSSLDVATEAALMKAVSALKGSKTIVVVSHRVSTVKSCNRLYRLEAGRVAEEGSPATMF